MLIKDRLDHWKDKYNILTQIDRFLTSRWFTILLAVFIVTVQGLGLDMIGFMVLGTLFTYICIFCKDTTPTAPIVCLAVFCVSLKNSPFDMASSFLGFENGEAVIGDPAPLYYSSEFLTMAIVFGSFVALSAIFRMAVYGNFNRILKKNYVFVGIVVLCMSFLLSGVFSKSYQVEDFWAGALQAVVFFVVYLFFITTVDFERFSLDYIANVMLAGLFCMLFALTIVYVKRFGDLGTLSGGWKSLLVAGWGTSNAVGAYMSFTIAACFYKMIKAKKYLKWIWSVVLVIGIVGIFLSLCRAAMLATVMIVPAGIIVGLTHKETRWHMTFTLLTYLLLIAAFILVLIEKDLFKALFDYFIQTADGGNLNELSSGRLEIWKRYFGYFLDDPVFGGGFLVDREAWLAAGSITEDYSFSMFTALAHSILFRALGSSGAVGVVAGAFHLITVGRLMSKSRSYSCNFLILALLGFLIVSMLDTVFYTPQFTFLYMAILVALQAEKEMSVKRKQRKNAIAREKAGKDYKPRVIFPFVEAGMGHIMPMQSIADAFEQKYGDVCAVVRSKFYSESNEKPLLRFEKNTKAEARKYAKYPKYGYFMMFMMDVFAPWILPKIIMDVYIPGAGFAARRHLEELNPDMVVSTHWSTPYYAHKIADRPINVAYVPDAEVIPLWRVPNDAVLISKEPGYQRALKKYKRRFDESNLKLVPFAIRKEALVLPMNKKENRRALGLDESKCTVTLMEGGYGEGKMAAIVKLLAQSELSLNVIAICGNNEKLLKELSCLQTKANISLKVEGLCKNPMPYFAASDVFIGKSGASTVAEATYFACASVITSYATTIERDNAAYYIDYVKSALKIFEPEAVVKKLAEWSENPKEMLALQENAKKVHDCYGSEKTADLLYSMLMQKFPHLKKK